MITHSELNEIDLLNVNESTFLKISKLAAKNNVTFNQMCDMLCNNYINNESDKKKFKENIKGFSNERQLLNE